ncbi:MAG: arginine--tRNA ligase [Actinobacteria bacterium]|uniref:arginine--tRNA ligase n=1 Tax=freshwater metagenome TaxID=449393 RepID=A0A6J7DKK9_9ZZZZ|nr:arginine--tRNA ligase [Actinomycetota bacterium]MSY97959.1 arginine--tRNA ligase [Actinomycetota bacterium]
MSRYAPPVTPEDLAVSVRAAVLEWVSQSGQVLEIPAELRLERPKSREHGDYATNIALALSKSAQLSPRVIAESLAPLIAEIPGVAAAEIAGPGFINIRLDSATLGQTAQIIVAAGAAYGTGAALAGQQINVEFISANPTGPLHLGHTRWAAVGDAIARVLVAAGAKVSTEFYINDRGVQMDKFGASVMASAHEQVIPEDGYQGAYIHDLAAAIVIARPSIKELPIEEQFVAFREAAYALQLKQQQQVLEQFRTHFDLWASERALHESNAVEHGLDRLRAQGHVYELDGAVWLRTTDFGDDKDRVLIKADGEYTYFASDTAYYVDKRERNFDICIYLLGADHHGYVNRLRAVAACNGDQLDQVEVLIGQLVKITRGGLEVKLSKRAGNIVTLDEFVDEVGVDAARYSLIRYPVDSPLTLDLEVITLRSNDNPVFYVQYAHARIASVLRNAAELGIAWQDLNFDGGLLSHERENELLGALAEFPRVVAGSAELREPHRVARYLEDLAAIYHRFYDSCRVLPRGDEELAPEQVARLWLCAATRQTIFNGLQLLGVSAPDRM